MDPIQSDGESKRRYVFRPRGTSTAVELAQLIADALFDACQGGMDDALVDITAVNGFESPGPLFRAWAVGLWARTAGEDFGDERDFTLVRSSEDQVVGKSTGLVEEVHQRRRQ